MKPTLPDPAEQAGSKPIAAPLLIGWKEYVAFPELGLDTSRSRSTPAPVRPPLAW